MSLFTPMANKLTPGKQGVAELTIFEVSRQEEEFTRLRAVVTGGREQPVPAGRYARLTVQGTLMMTDTPMEQRTNATLVHRAKGEVLIAGLGVGMVLEPLLANPEVTQILVVEKFKDVIDLVAPHFKDAIDNERLVILNEDIFNFVPQDEWTWDTIYFDIWPTICGDNLAEMERLHNQFRYHLADGGWMSSWCYDQLKRDPRYSRDDSDDPEGETEMEDDEYEDDLFEPEEEDDE